MPDASSQGMWCRNRSTPIQGRSIFTCGWHTIEISDVLDTLPFDALYVALQNALLLSRFRTGGERVPATRDLRPAACDLRPGVKIANLRTRQE